MGMNKLSILFLSIFLPALLAGCQSDEADDLDKFMAESAKGMSRNVPPLPQVQPYIPLVFDIDGSLLDPFKPKKVVANSGFQPDLNRPKEPLELFPLENLQYVGALNMRNEQYALVETPESTIHQVKSGNYLGTNFGLITAISEFEVTIKEIIQDELSGDWIERTSTLNLQE